MKPILAMACALGLLVLQAGTAEAILYKNPGTTISQGQFTGGVVLESTTRKVKSDFIPGETVDLKYTIFAGTFGFGIGKAGVIELQVGQLTGKIDDPDFESASGAVIGAELRYNVAGGGSGLQHGLIVAYHHGSTSKNDVDTDVNQADLGYGIAIPIGGKGAFYVGGAYSSMTGTVSVGNFSVDFDGNSSFGGFGGVEFLATPGLSLGFELQAVHNTAFGFYLDGRF